ncbi:MAG: NAD-dependent deacetylase [Betaproteobacteria bacterium]|nr:NAD-dependent deacetylase [Betaproteobacteria bacterium]MCL2886079.1 NAD-dependent deacetylase [Betaproteobacteria bacterium]
MTSDNSLFSRCADLIAQSSGLLITAGAGMGVDSGLPDFRGAEGFWRAYPPLRQARLRFEEMANPQAFARDPGQAWGFYGHRLQCYRETVPHRGFGILREMAACLPDGAFVLTSNVDGHFQKAGFAAERVCEVHGSIHYLQCAAPCSDRIWPADDFAPVVDAAVCRLAPPLPCCPDCGGLARPNILMFGDWNWLEWRTSQQEARLAAWREAAANPVVIELGAGKSVATIRMLGERSGLPLIRINLRDPEVSRSNHIGVPMGALAALEGIRAALAEMGFLPGES